MSTQNPQDLQEQIDDYLQGSHPDPAAFEQALAQDPQLRQEMEATRLALAAISVQEDYVLKQRLRSLDESRSVTTPVAETQTTAKVVPLEPRRRRTWIRYAAVAAVVCLLAGYFLLRPAPGARLTYALDRVAPYDNIAYTITKGGEPTTEDARASAYVAYEAGDYAAAEAAFGRLADSSPNDAFYLAQSLLAQDKYAAAEARFRDLSTTEDFQLAEEAVFYAAVARLGLGQTDEAVQTLESIGQDGSHPMHRAAVDLLTDLR